MYICYVGSCHFTFEPYCCLWLSKSLRSPDPAQFPASCIGILPTELGGNNKQIELGKMLTNISVRFFSLPSAWDPEFGPSPHPHCHKLWGGLGGWAQSSTWFVYLWDTHFSHFPSVDIAHSQMPFDGATWTVFTPPERSWQNAVANLNPKADSLTCDSIYSSQTEACKTFNCCANVCWKVLKNVSARDTHTSRT